MADQTPVYGLRFQELSDAPHGPNLGDDLALDVETELIRIDNSLTTQQTSITSLQSSVTTLQTDVAALGFVGDVLTNTTLSGISTEVIVDSVLNKTLTAGHKIKLSWSLTYDQASPPFPSFALRWQSGSTITVAGSTVLRETNIDSSTLSKPLMYIATLNVPSTGTYSFASSARSNGGAILNVHGRYLLVENMGP